MLTLLTKSLRSSKPKSLPSRLPPQCCPSFANQIAPLTNKSFPKSGSGQSDKHILQKLKKIATLRREFERRDGVEIFNGGWRHAMKTSRQGVAYETASANGMKVYQLQREYLELVRALSKAESRDTHQQALHSVTKLEGVLEVDAAQRQPVLRMQERLAVKDVLKEFLKLDKQAEKYVRRTYGFLALISVGLLGRYLYRRFYRTPVGDSEFSKIHEPEQGVE